MPKAKLEFKAEQVPFLAKAGKFTGIQYGQAETVGNRAFIECNYRTAQQLVDTIQLANEIKDTGDEVNDTIDAPDDQPEKDSAPSKKGGK